MSTYSRRLVDEAGGSSRFPSGKTLRGPRGGAPRYCVGSPGGPLLSFCGFRVCAGSRSARLLASRFWRRSRHCQFPPLTRDARSRMASEATVFIPNTARSRVFVAPDQEYITLSFPSGYLPTRAPRCHREATESEGADSQTGSSRTHPPQKRELCVKIHCRSAPPPRNPITFQPRLSKT